VFETLSLFPISQLIVAAVVVVVVYVITFAVVFGTFVFLTRRRLPLLRSRFNPSHLRVRLWQFMAAIVVFGLSLELVILAETSFRAIRKAEDHAGRQRGTDFFLASSASSGCPGDRSGAWVTDYYRELGRYHQQMSEKYYDVARHPWRPVASDPPEPTFEEALQREMQKFQRIQELLSAISASLSALQSATVSAYRVFDKAATAAGMLVTPR
jgi:hypothetical protein